MDDLYLSQLQKLFNRMNKTINGKSFLNLKMKTFIIRHFYELEKELSVNTTYIRLSVCNSAAESCVVLHQLRAVPRCSHSYTLLKTASGFLPYFPYFLNSMCKICWYSQQLVGIATRCELDDPVFESWWVLNFPHLPIQWLLDLFTGGKSVWMWR